MSKKFDIYIKTLLNILKKEGITTQKKSSTFTLSDIIEEFRSPKR